MTSKRQNLLFSAITLLVLLSNTACPTWLIDTDDSCTWAIANTNLTIPTGSIPTGAILTLHNVFIDTSVSNPTLNIYLLHNPQPGLVHLADTSSCDPFECCGTPIGQFSQWTTPGQNLSVDLAQVNNPQSPIWSVFQNPFTQMLGNQDTITYSSALLELLDYSGSDRSFGFGFYSQGFTCSGITLRITIQSQTQATNPQIFTYTYGNWAAPQLQPIPDYSIYSDQKLEFFVTGTDEDGYTPLSYSIDNLPEGATFTGQTFTWTPTQSQQGTWPLVFRVTDGRLRKKINRPDQGL